MKKLKQQSILFTKVEDNTAYFTEIDFVGPRKYAVETWQKAIIDGYLANDSGGYWQKPLSKLIRRKGFRKFDSKHLVSWNYSSGR